MALWYAKLFLRIFAQRRQDAKEIPLHLRVLCATPLIVQLEGFTKNTTKKDDVFTGSFWPPEKLFPVHSHVIVFCDPEAEELIFRQGGRVLG